MDDEFRSVMMNPNDPGAFEPDTTRTPSTRAERLLVLSDYYGWAVGGIARLDVPRFAAVRTFRSLHDSFQDACDELADQILDDGVGTDLAIYDLDTGERIELHVSTPVVTRSEEQGAMENPLQPEASDASE